MTKMKRERVKEALIAGLLELLKENTVSEITISMLCEKSGVSRMSFYRKYENIEEILIEKIDDMISEYKKQDNFKSSESKEENQEVVLKFFNYVYENRDILSKVRNTGMCDHFLNVMTEYLLDKRLSDKSSKAKKYAMVSYAGAVYDVVLTWIDGGFEEPPEELAGIITNVFTGTVKF